MTFGEQLKRWREEAGRSQVELADALGIKQQTISQWENGRAFPHQSRATTIEQALGLAPQTVLVALHEAVRTDRSGAVMEAPAAVRQPADLDGRLADLTPAERADVEKYIDWLIDRRGR